MSTLTANIVNFIQKMGVTPLSAVMQFLVGMVSTEATDGCTVSSETVCTDTSSGTLVSLCCKMIPENFVRSLLDQIASEVVIPLITRLLDYWMIIIYIYIYYNNNSIYSGIPENPCHGM